jgi:hypothetical protein
MKSTHRKVREGRKGNAKGQDSKSLYFLSIPLADNRYSKSLQSLRLTTILGITIIPRQFALIRVNSRLNAFDFDLPLRPLRPLR